MTASHFTADTLSFLRDLEAHNDREWFQANRERYEDHVRHPAIRFIADFAPNLESISPHFVADPRPVGGSMFRIHRDVRFSKDKSPYKTHVGLQFRHASGKDVHAPGFYLGIEPGKSMAAFGIWHPDGPTLRRIRDVIVDDPDRWRDVADAAGAGSRFAWYGDSLVRAPKGYPKDHPCIDDLRRKDFVLASSLDDGEIISGVLKRYAEICRIGGPFVRYLCDAVELPY